jgi:hypothetical protein
MLLSLILDSIQHGSHQKDSIDASQAKFAQGITDQYQGRTTYSFAVRLRNYDYYSCL